MKDGSGRDEPAFIYDRIARQFHWWTAALVFIQIPIEVTMKRRGEGAVTDAMFSTHKLLGFTILLIVIARLIYRLVHNTTTRADDRTLAANCFAHQPLGALCVFAYHRATWVDRCLVLRSARHLQYLQIARAR